VLIETPAKIGKCTTVWKDVNTQVAAARHNALRNHIHTRAIPKVSGLDVLDNNIFYNPYISETYILYEL